MSPLLDHLQLGLECFPRVSGDEPSVSMVWTFTPPFSPRERG